MLPVLCPNPRKGWLFPDPQGVGSSASSGQPPKGWGVGNIHAYCMGMLPVTHSSSRLNHSCGGQAKPPLSHLAATIPAEVSSWLSKAVASRAIPVEKSVEPRGMRARQRSRLLSPLRTATPCGQHWNQPRVKGLIITGAEHPRETRTTRGVRPPPSSSPAEIQIWK